MDISQVAAQALDFDNQLTKTKERLAPAEFAWYPYGTLNNFIHLDRLLTGANRDFMALCSGGPVADVGAADGDSAFFLESLGVEAHVIDYAPTNHNGCRGVRLLKSELGSGVRVDEVDLDSQFALPQDSYELVFFLGLLYHLKNPYYALEMLARSARFALISTRITRFNSARPGGEGSAVNRDVVSLESVPAAYLVAPDETNNDPTNYWIFTDAGLHRILDRTGWDVVDYMRVGETTRSDPATAEGDERAFCLVRSRVLR